MEALSFLPILAQSDSGGGAIIAIIGALFMLVMLGVMAIMVVSAWKIFTKAGHPGWAAIVPIYNIYIMVLIAKKEAWWVILFFIPLVGFIANILVSIDIAKAFGKGAGFGLGMAFLPFIFYPLLAFGSATYQGGGQSALAT